MEKVLAYSDQFGFCSWKIDEVNQHLAEGWSVKSVTMAHDKAYVHVVFVLEQKQK